MPRPPIGTLFNWFVNFLSFDTSIGDEQTPMCIKQKVRPPLCHSSCFFLHLVLLATDGVCVKQALGGTPDRFSLPQ
jgi:hypothetical protein